MGPIQSSINTALGVAAIASGLTNKKQVEKAQDKLDKSEENLAKTTEDLAKTTAEKEEKDKTLSAVKDEQNMKLGGNIFNVSNDLPTAKATNIDANDKIDVISSNSIKYLSISVDVTTVADSSVFGGYYKFFGVPIPDGIDANKIIAIIPISATSKTNNGQQI